MKSKLFTLPLKDRHPKNIGRQQIRGELHPIEIEPQSPRQQMGEGRLTHSGEILYQKMSLSQNTGNSQLHLRSLAQYMSVYLLDRAIKFL